MRSGIDRLMQDLTERAMLAEVIVESEQLVREGHKRRDSVYPVLIVTATQVPFAPLSDLTAL